MDLPGFGEIFKAPARYSFALSMASGALLVLGKFQGNEGRWLVAIFAIATALAFTFVVTGGFQWVQERKKKSAANRDLAAEVKRLEGVVSDLSEQIRTHNKSVSGEEWDVKRALHVHISCVSNSAVELTDDGASVHFALNLVNSAPFPIEVEEISGKLIGYIMGQQVLIARNFKKTFPDRKMKLNRGDAKVEHLSHGPVSLDPRITFHNWAQNNANDHSQAPGVIWFEYTAVVSAGEKWGNRTRDLTDVTQTWAHAQDNRSSP